MTARQLATLLDALQGWIDRRRQSGGFGILNLARPSHFDHVEPLTADEAEKLYKELHACPPNDE